MSVDQSIDSQRSLIDVEPEALKLWCPVDAVIADNQPAIEWMDLHGVDFAEPFFSETLARIDSGERRARVVTQIATLLRFEKVAESLSPSGFIFHSSRCGSTLVANACRAVKNSIVIAEAPAIDKLITRFFTDAPIGSAKELLYMLLLRAMIAALGQPLKGDECHYFIKLACTSTLQIHRLRRIWPDVPFVFLYRDPVEIIVSNLKSIPEWMRAEVNPAAAAAIVGVDEQQLSSLGAEEYCARSVGRFFEAVDSNFDAGIKLLNYEQISFDSLISILNFFGIQPTPEETDVIKRVSRLYSKDFTSTRIFEDDSAQKRFSASPGLCLAAEKWARSSYDKLNARLSNPQ
jgi:hypothetical protein